jgi:alpha-galactosidase
MTGSFSSLRFLLVVIVSLLMKIDSFRIMISKQQDFTSSSRLMVANDQQQLEPISIQRSAKRVSSAMLPFFATLLTAGLAVRASGTGDAGFLTEPTLEFKDEEKKVADFKAQQQKIRKSWDEVISKLEASDSPVTTEACIRDLTAILTKYNSGIPSGVKKLELVKTIRAKKYVMVGKKQKILPTWSKDSEIAYQVASCFTHCALFLLEFVPNYLFFFTYEIHD